MTLLGTSQLRNEYGPDHCTEHEHAGAQEAWDALASIMQAFGYELRADVCGSRACRPITGGKNYSLHAFYLKVLILLWNLAKRIPGAVACDFNWNTNPYGARLVTDMPRAMVDAICAIRTRSGAQVFRWGGYYSGNKDAMHYELVCSAADLETGIDPATVHGGFTSEEDDFMASADEILQAIRDGDNNLATNIGDAANNIVGNLRAYIAAVIDPAKIAAEVAKHLPAGSASSADVEAAVRKVFADAGDSTG